MLLCLHSLAILPVKITSTAYIPSAPTSETVSKGPLHTHTHTHSKWERAINYVCRVLDEENYLENSSTFGRRHFWARTSVEASAKQLAINLGAIVQLAGSGFRVESYSRTPNPRSLCFVVPSIHLPPSGQAPGLGQLDRYLRSKCAIAGARKWRIRTSAVVLTFGMTSKLRRYTASTGAHAI